MAKMHTLFGVLLVFALFSGPASGVQQGVGGQAAASSRLSSSVSIGSGSRSLRISTPHDDAESEAPKQQAPVVPGPGSTAPGSGPNDLHTLGAAAREEAKQLTRDMTVSGVLGVSLFISLCLVLVLQASATSSPWLPFYILLSSTMLTLGIFLYLVATGKLERMWYGGAAQNHACWSLCVTVPPLLMLESVLCILTLNHLKKQDALASHKEGLHEEEAERLKKIEEKQMEAEHALATQRATQERELLAQRAQLEATMRAEQEKLDLERAAAAKKASEDRIAAQKIEAELKAREEIMREAEEIDRRERQAKAQREAIAARKAEQVRLAAEKADALRKEMMTKAKSFNEEADNSEAKVARLAKEEAERLAKEEAARKDEAERLAAEKVELERIAQEKAALEADVERLAAHKAELERMHAANRAAEEAAEEAAKAAEQACPGGHPLVVFVTDTDDWRCSGCHLRVPKGVNLYECRPCDYDLCTECYLGLTCPIEVKETKALVAKAEKSLVELKKAADAARQAEETLLSKESVAKKDVDREGSITALFGDNPKLTKLEEIRKDLDKARVVRRNATKKVNEAKEEVLAAKEGRSSPRSPMKSSPRPEDKRSSK